MFDFVRNIMFLFCQCFVYNVFVWIPLYAFSYNLIAYGQTTQLRKTRLYADDHHTIICVCFIGFVGYISLEVG